MSRPRVLFLCLRNAARSQMAEGWLRHLAAERFEGESAGVDRRGFLDPLAIQAMEELGIDISRQVPKLVLGLMRERWDYVVTVSAETEGRCPPFPRSAVRLSWPFPDPTRAPGSPAQRLDAFGNVRDTIGSRIRDWLATT